MQFGVVAALISLVVLVYLLMAMYILTRYMVRSCVNRDTPPLRLEVVVIDRKSE